MLHALRQMILQQRSWVRRSILWLPVAIVALATVALFSSRRSVSDDQDRITSSLLSHDALRTWAMLQQCSTARTIAEKSKGTQLSDAMMFWMADALHSAQYTNAANTKFLVFGLGNDSPTWKGINCNGRTVFIEDSEVWYRKVMLRHRGIEAYLYHYNTTLARAQEFYDNPFMMEVNKDVDSECFDVILIDAPMGFSPSSPGRMIPAYYAQQRASECVLQEERKNIVFVFMHDMNRKGEQEIAGVYFKERDGWIPLGQVTDGQGRKLNGWAMVKI